MKAVSLATALAGSLCCNHTLAATPPRSRIQTIDIVLKDFVFTPQALHLRQGQAYRLRLVNRSTGGHNFSAPAFFAAARIDPADAGLISGGKIELGANQSRSVRLVPAAGAYNVTCTHFLHAGFGMVGSIIVN